MRVTVGVSGGIAAYKAAELVRALQRRGMEVHVVMTEAATRFVQPLTFAHLPSPISEPHFERLVLFRSILRS